MSDDLRITVAELQKRMEAGEDFTIIDTRNPQAWAEALEIVPEAIRVPLDSLDEQVSRIPKNKPIVAYCT
jgi:rhodanese-related sulfurtransferase